jgi:hypothetical protein
VTRRLSELRKGVNAVKEKYEGHSYTSFYISRPCGKNWFVMIRVHDLAGRDYGYSFRMNDDEARKVVAAGILEPWFVHEKFFKVAA